MPKFGSSKIGTKVKAPLYVICMFWTPKAPLKATLAITQIEHYAGGKPRDFASLWAKTKLGTINTTDQGMPDIKGIAHFSIPVSDVDRSTKFYTEVVGCKFLGQRPDKVITFLDAGGVCVLLIKRPAPIAKGPLDGSDGVHHAFMLDAAAYQAAVDGLRAKGIDVFFEEDRRGGVIDGPRAYFRDPDGTALEFIDRTAYGPAQK